MVASTAAQRAVTTVAYLVASRAVGTVAQRDARMVASSAFHWAATKAKKSVALTAEPMVESMAAKKDTR